MAKTYVDLNGALTAPTGVLNATSWKGPAILPRGNQPRSPPFFPDGHSENSWATCGVKIEKSEALCIEILVSNGTEFT